MSDPLKLSMDDIHAIMKAKRLLAVLSTGDPVKFVCEDAAGQIEWVLTKDDELSSYIIKRLNQVLLDKGIDPEGL